MRCYFMRDGHIAAVEVLTAGVSDAEAIEISRALFHEREASGFYDGFEVWDQARHVYRFLSSNDAHHGRYPPGSSPRPNGGAQV